jgi:hypothetical protein
MRKSAEDAQNEQHATSPPQTRPSLRSPVTFEPQQHPLPDKTMEGAYRSRSYPHMLPHLRQGAFNPRPHPYYAPRFSENVYGSQAYQMDKRSVDGGYRTSSQACGSPSFNQAAYTHAPYIHGAYNQATWTPMGPIRDSMTDPVTYGTRRVSFAPSPETRMGRSSRGTPYRDTGGMRDASEELEGSRMREDTSDYTSDEGAGGRFKEEPHTPGHSGPSQDVSGDPGHSISLPQTPQNWSAMYQSHSDSRLNAYSDSSDFLEGTPSFMEKIINPPGGPANYTMSEDGRLSTTVDSDYESLIEGFESLRGRYPPWRNIGEGRRESRYSGGVEPWPCNSYPEAVSRRHVSDAALLKRGLPLTNRKKVIKRAYGVNDPENIAIINMKDNQGLSWQEIVDRLNEKRVAEGKTKFLTVTAVANRYSRNCPVLMSAAGIKFIPLSVRRNMANGEVEAPRIDWTKDNDVTLVTLFNAYEVSRWETLAEEFTGETGIEVHPAEVARRYSAIN